MVHMGDITLQGRYADLAATICKKVPAEKLEAAVAQALVDAYEDGYDTGCDEGREVGYQMGVSDGTTGE